MQELAEAAYWLADEVRDGKWDHVPNIKIKPVPVCPEMIDGEFNYEVQRD
jgi:hypothetical protein